MPEEKQGRVRDKGKDLGRLCQAIGKSRLQLRFFREQRREMVRQYAGAHWSEDTAERSVPINLLSLYVNIVGRNLIAKNPRALLSTFEKSEVATVAVTQAYLNKQIEKINLAETLQRVVLDALFSIGICKVAIASPEDSAVSGWRYPAGGPLVEYVDLDDFVYDIHARDFRHAGYMGHRYRVPLEVVRESKVFGKRRKDLQADDDLMFNQEGDERIQMLGRGYYSNQEEYEDFIDLWEIYLPRHKSVVTVADQDLGDTASDNGDGWRRAALREQTYIGPPCGPYHILGLGIVPSNAMPKGPIQDIFDLHMAVNNVIRKVIQQARDCKTITVFRGSADQDADRVNSTNDGQSVRVDDPEGVKQLVMTVPNPSLVALLEQFIQRVSWLSGNLDIMGGLSPQSKTATQDKLLNQNSSGGTLDMQEKTTVFTSGVLDAMCWLYHHHPTLVMKVKHSVDGLPDISSVEQSFPNNPDVHQNQPGLMVRTNDYDDMDVRVDPYSLQNQTPQIRLQFIQGLMQSLMPMMPLLQQQGVMPDMNAWLKKIGEYADSPDVAQLFTIREPPAESTNPQSDQVGSMPPQTERTYTRRSLGGDSQQAREALQSNALSAQSNQESNGQVQPVGA